MESTISSRGHAGALPDYYGILGVSASASGLEIEAAYWAKARTDRDSLPLLNEALEILLKKEGRAQYDAQRKASAVQQQRRRRTPPPPPRDISRALKERWKF